MLSQHPWDKASLAVIIILSRHCWVNFLKFDSSNFAPVFMSDIGKYPFSWALLYFNIWMMLVLLTESVHLYCGILEGFAQN